MTEQQYNNQKAILIGKSKAYSEIMVFATVTKDQSLIDMLDGLIGLNEFEEISLQSQYLESVELENK